MLGVYFLRKRRKKGHFSRVHFVFLVLSLRLKMRLRFVLRIILIVIYLPYCFVIRMFLSNFVCSFNNT